MVFVEDDHMVEELASDRADPTFCNSILPRTSRRDSRPPDLPLL